MKPLTNNPTTTVKPAGTPALLPQAPEEQPAQAKPSQAQCCAKASPTVAGCHD
jgi:hypothetical protein